MRSQIGLDTSRLSGEIQRSGDRHFFGAPENVPKWTNFLAMTDRLPHPLKSRPKPLSKEEISRRLLLFQTFKEREACYDRETPISRNQILLRSIIAGILDDEAILGHDISDYKADLLAFVHEDDDFEHMIGG